MSPYLKAMRPHQWVKNFIVFVPLVAGHAFSWDVVSQGLLAGIAFCCAASAGYLLNDIVDRSDDRRHPTKSARPIASGALPVSRAVLMIPILLALGGLVSLEISPSFVIVLAAYFSGSAIYSAVLKRFVIVDICALSVLYTARVLAGGLATNIEVSNWLLAFSVFFFLCLGAVKRQAELVREQASGGGDVPGRGYAVTDLAVVSQIAITSGFLSVLVLALYVQSSEVRLLYAVPDLLWGICLILLYWIGRAILLTNRGGMHDDPVVFALRDPVSWVCLMLVVAGLVGAAKWH